MKHEEKSTLEDYLLARVKKSGYPLEIEISDILEKENFIVFNTQYYFDREAHQGRDIDIDALLFEEDMLRNRLSPFVVRTDLAIECKKSETHAWVLYTRPRIALSSYYTKGQIRTNIREPEKSSLDSFDFFLKDKCLNLHYNEFTQMAIAYEEIKKGKLDSESGRKRDNSSRNEIFEAVNQLVKYTSYEIHQIHERVAKRPQTYKHRLITLFFPVIVFDGDMFEAYLESGEPTLERTKHLLLGTHYRCPYCRDVESYTIDVVHRSHFNEFIQLWKRHISATKEAMLRNHTKLVEKAKREFSRTPKI